MGQPLPTGTVTFLFTDVEGSTRLLEQAPAAYRDAVRRHHALLRAAVEAHHGAVFETVGDAVYAAFAHASDAVAAALAGQRALAAEPWPEGAAPRVRMGLHTGEVELQGAHYFGAPLYRCARLMGTAHGGQVVLSEATAALVGDSLPQGVTLRDLGEQRLRDLLRPERVFQLVHPDLPAAFPPLRSLDALPNNLPLQLTSFVGRGRELAAVADLLGRQRLVTLTGPGGSGKTRLALQAAADLLPDYPDGVWLAELAALADHNLVPQTVAQSVGVTEEPLRPLLATLADALRPRRLLLVLDNCEHVLDACSRLADDLLRACPSLTILATSREALGIAGETAWRVPSLTLPDALTPLSTEALAQHEAVRLFVDRARAVQPAFTVTPQNAPAVAQVCARLDGIPLALELAAARVRVLPVEQLLGRLEDRFRLLTGGSRTALERHQTLQAAVDWSYDLLIDDEKALFARLSVFAGGFTLEAAEQVGGGDGLDELDVLDLLTRLVDKSLVVVDEQPDGTARYRLLETLRAYARTKLAAGGAVDRVRYRHAAHFMALAEQAQPELRGPDSAVWHDRLERELDNLRGALGWAEVGGLAAAGMRLVLALYWFWFWRHPHEGRSWLARLLDLPDEPAPTAPERSGGLVSPALRARALGTAGQFAAAEGDLEAAQALGEAALVLGRPAGDRAAIAAALSALGEVAGARGDDAAARRLQEERLALREALGDRVGTAFALRGLAAIAARSGDASLAEAHYRRALALHREVGDRSGTAGVLGELGRLAHDRGDYAGARREYEASLALSGEAGDPQGGAVALGRLAGLAAAQGDPAAARGAYAVSLRGFHAVGRRQAVALTLVGLAAVAGAEGQWARALRLAGAGAAAAAALGAAARRPRWGLPSLADAERIRAQGHTALGEAAAAAAWDAGQAMPLEQAIAYALEEPTGDA